MSVESGQCRFIRKRGMIDPLNAELNPICHLLALLGGATIVVVSRLRVKTPFGPTGNLRVRTDLKS